MVPKAIDVEKVRMLKVAIRKFPNPRANHVFSRWDFLGLEQGGIFHFLTTASKHGYMISSDNLYGVMRMS